MKKNILSIAFGLIILSSCTKDIEMCVEGDMNPSETGTYTYTWCGSEVEFLEWQYGGTTYSGNSVTLNLNYKGTHGFSVNATNKRKEGYQYYEINIGEREGRIEPTACNGKLTYQNNIWAYLYTDVALIETDLESGIKNNCIDSIELSSSNYYSGQHQSSSAKVAGFADLGVGDYFVYLQERQISGESYYGINNIFDLMVYGTSHLEITQENIDLESDAIVFPYVNDNSGSTSNDFLLDLISKTYALTDVHINGTPMGVSACNADDVLTLDLNGTFEQNVGADNCSGGQATSVGTFYPTFNVCDDASSSSFQLSASSGSWQAAGTIYLYYFSTDQIRVQMWVGADMIEQFYTAQ